MLSMRTIYDHLSDFLADNSSLDAFKDWMVGASWGMDDAVSAEARQLVHAIELTLAEESGGYLSKEELLADLQLILDQASARSGT